MEEPGFFRVRETLRGSGYLPLPIEIAADGISIEKLMQSEANVVYVTPSHQFPMGYVYPVGKRMQLLEWAGRNNGFIIEDDYDSEFRYRGRPIPALKGLDTHDSVIYLGTFSKAFTPSLRMGFMVLPKGLLNIYQEKWRHYKSTVPLMSQMAMSDFMSKGHWERHLNRMRVRYRKKQEVLISCLQSELGETVSVIGEQSGLHVVISVNLPVSENWLLEKAKQHGVLVFGLSVHISEKLKHLLKILLGYGGLGEREIVQGIQLLKKAWIESGKGD